MSNPASLARSLIALRAAQSLLLLVREDSASALSALRKKALLESSLFQAHLSLRHYCDASAGGVVGSEVASGFGDEDLRQTLFSASASSNPSLVELKGLLSVVSVGSESASWLDYLLNQYQGLLSGEVSADSPSKTSAAIPQIIAVASESSFSDRTLTVNTLSLALSHMEQFLNRQQDNLQEW